MFQFNAKSTDGVAPLVQLLKGHTGRVYGVDFHPTEPTLLSCSEDSTFDVISNLALVCIQYSLFPQCRLQLNAGFGGLKVLEFLNQTDLSPIFTINRWPKMLLSR